MIYLHVHSNHSLLEGTATIRQLVARAVEYGMNTLALTDTDGLYGAIPFYEAAKAAGVRPIVGVWLDPCVLLAKDREGYAQLCHVVTAVRLGEVKKEDLASWPFSFDDTHLFVMSGDRGVLRSLQKRGLAPLAAVEHRGDSRSQYHAEGLVHWARGKGLQAVAVHPVYFLEAGHYSIHRTLAAIRKNATVDTLAPGDAASPDAFFHDPPQLERRYALWPELVSATEGVAEECHLELELGRPLFPDFPLPEKESAFSWLWKETFAGLQRRYRPLTPAIIDRVRYELGLINDLGFAPYFLIVSDIVRFARERAIPAVGRGSAANSVVAYALGITRVDPFRYDLYFERFMNRARTDCPDIDLDICWRRRDEVLEYVYGRYGSDRVAMISTLNTFRARSSVREVAKARGLTDRQIGAVAKLLPHYHAGVLSNAVQHIPECRGIRLDKEPLKGIVETAEFIDGFPRHLSIHAGGVVIAPAPLTRFVPLQRAAKGLVITQYDMHPIEKLGLVKMDLLGHRALTVIDDTVHAVRKNRDIPLDIESIPGNDPLTARMLREGRTLACFQVESPAMRGLLQKVQACDVPTLIQCIALVRPGASGSGMKQHFIDRHHGREEVAYLHPAMERVLGDTYGVMIYQEDVLKVAHAVAGMDLTEADVLRRAMSKKRGPREMAKSMKGFLERARENGVEEGAAQAIWELIANFAAYAYCKAHASTYGELAYQCAYLKAHFPAEFFAAVLSNRGGFYSPPVYAEEAKRCGLELRPPHIHKSQYEYTVEDDAIRVGFLEIRNLSHAAIQAILESRPFVGITDMIERAGLCRADAEALCQAGALDAFGLPRPMQLWEIKGFKEGAASRGCAAGSRDAMLFAPDGKADRSALPPVPGYSEKKRAHLEWESLGLLVGRHPLDFCFPGADDTAPLISSTALAFYEGQRVTLIGWLLTERRLAVKKGHGVMKFLTLEDPFGAYEAVLFPETYQRCGHLLTSRGPYRITGQPQNDHGAFTLLVEQVERAAPQAGGRDAGLLSTTNLLLP